MSILLTILTICIISVIIDSYLIIKKIQNKMQKASKEEIDKLCEILDAEHNLSNVTRVEVIQHSEPFDGRAYVNSNAKDVFIEFQDDGRTLKVFLK